MRPLPIPRVFLWLAIPAGLGYALLLPPFQVPDEDAHLLRAYGISQGRCASPPEQQVPASLLDLWKDFPPHVEQHRRLSASDYFLLAKAPLQPDTTQPVANLNGNIYSCAPYLPAAALIGIGRLVRAPALVIFYGGRLMHLALFIASVYAALALLPFARLSLFALALMPMTLQQAASLSADALTFSATFLYYALLLYLAFGKIPLPLPLRLQAVLIALLTFTLQCKMNLALLLLLFLIPAARFRSRRTHLAFLAAAILIPCLTAAAWQLWNRGNTVRFEQFRKTSHIDIQQNASDLSHQPGRFAAAFGATLRARGTEYLREFVGRLGLLSVPLPVWLASMICLLLPLVAITEAVPLDAAGRLLCASSFIVAAIGIFGLLWTIATPAPQVLIEGVQGRYFIPIAFPLLLAIGIRRPPFDRSWLEWTAAGAALLASIIALSAVARAYYA